MDSNKVSSSVNDSNQSTIQVTPSVSVNNDGINKVEVETKKDSIDVEDSTKVEENKVNSDVTDTDSSDVNISEKQSNATNLAKIAKLEEELAHLKYNLAIRNSIGDDLLSKILNYPNQEQLSLLIDNKVKDKVSYEQVAKLESSLDNKLSKEQVKNLIAEDLKNTISNKSLDDKLKSLDLTPNQLQEVNKLISKEIDDANSKLKKDINSNLDKLNIKIDSGLKSLSPNFEKEVKDLINNRLSHSSLPDNYSQEVKDLIDKAILDYSEKTWTDRQLTSLNNLINEKVNLSVADRAVEVEALVNNKEAMEEIIKRYIFPADKLNNQILEAYKLVSEDFSNKIHEKLTSYYVEKKLELEEKYKEAQLAIESALALKSKTELECKQMNLKNKQELYEKDLSLASAKEIQQELSNKIQYLELQLNNANSKIDKYNRLCSLIDENNPDQVLEEIQNLREEKERLENRLDTLSIYDNEENLRILQEDYGKLKNAYELAVQNNQGSIEAQSKINDLELKNSEIRTLLIKEQHNNEALLDNIKCLENSLKRYRTPDGVSQDRNERIKQIEKVVIERNNDQYPKATIINEIDWLNGVKNKIDEYGFKFSDRIINSFHTSLKIAMYSPITVLAGISGTGKSELPHLYSLFGGINFLSIPVQPNWDCQESMLGYYNPIEESFDAQPVLRLLAQTQKPLKADPANEVNIDFVNNSLKDQMTIILLDEMNLAHVELYFAEFLSKFELRRGQNPVKECLDVKIGSGLLPYQILLDHNVLWVGTMNQDETTKTLSDKVLDRGIIINFPCPKNLVSRNILKQPEKGRMLTKEIWFSWQAKENYIDEYDESIFNDYKKIVQAINAAMGTIGRALGHRVWQSIEAYMLNYPDVLKFFNKVIIKEEEKFVKSKKYDDDQCKLALKMAFEDQIVQKIMPKLRGIETRGYSKENCLDPIHKILSDSKFDKIAKAFSRACDSSYGQFSWNSAYYLDDLD